MDIKGKVIFGALGAFLGVYGIAAGIVVGHFLLDNKPKSLQSDAFDSYKKRQGQFVYHVFTLCAKMAKVKGTVSHSEITFMERLMRQQFNLSKEGRKQAVEIWNKAKSSESSFEQQVHRFYSDFRTERHHIMNMMDLLFAVAAADGQLHPQQELLLVRAATIFQINRLQFNRIKQRYFFVQPQMAWQPLDPHYAILGAEPKESLPEIKKKYRALALKWHPDKVMASGASEQAVKHAHKKFQELNEAFEAIEKTRK